MAGLVPNPLYQALGDALRAVEPLAEELWNDFDRPCRTFQSGKVWTGPAAKRFEVEFVAHRARVRASSDRVVAELRRVLARTPARVSEEEARAIATRYGLR
ncbi:hypothetical protein Ssi02_29890 [Sinosporangium siamense]|uniref:Uncharacterized protein n=1 Tax=Sinosporangium siamense TaxID=1367973 RepID=A0A919RF55_9ACTN|nr:hypothetical protein Ssi02_29890 [Sinosporangium siamense]